MCGMCLHNYVIKQHTTGSVSRLYLVAYYIRAYNVSRYAFLVLLATGDLSSSTCMLKDEWTKTR